MWEEREMFVDRKQDLMSVKAVADVPKSRLLNIKKTL